MQIFPKHNVVALALAIALAASLAAVATGAQTKEQRQSRLLRTGPPEHIIPVESCAAIQCLFGYECDPLTLGCVAVTCDAPTACPEGETCVPEDIFCIRAPCPQFTCEPDVPLPNCAAIQCLEGHECDPLTGNCVAVTCDAFDACPNGEVCVPEEIFCIRSPCPQFTCEVGEPLPSCAAIQCLEGHECDPLTGTCVAVTCDAFDACPCGLECVPEEIFCIRDPCPQFTCKDPNDDCVICPLVFPTCEDDCENCKVIPQTCEECAFAMCLDDKCVFCPQVVPQCDESCQKCIVHPQSCHKCSYAECVSFA